jgi:DNA-binding transcriptional ArsR family regulator
MENEFSQIASLIGDPVRAKILWALLDGRAYTATELAVYADTTPQNISMHLNKLVNADLLSVESQGRHRYYNYSRADVPYAIEAIASLIPGNGLTASKLAEDKPVRYCRSCYDHLAGKVGVLLTDGLLKQQFIYKQDNSFEVSPEGETWFNSLSIDVDLLKKQKRSFARPCLDWSERKHHLAGSLGAALLNRMIVDGWVRKEKDSRTMIVTRKGEQAFFDYFKIDIR